MRYTVIFFFHQWGKKSVVDLSQDQKAQVINHAINDVLNSLVFAQVSTNTSMKAIVMLSGPLTYDTTYTASIALSQRVLVRTGASPLPDR